MFKSAFLMMEFPKHFDFLSRIHQTTLLQSIIHMPFMTPPQGWSPINCLPREILCFIFSFFEGQDFWNVSSTCKSWNQILWSCVKQISLSLRKGPYEYSFVEKLSRISVLEIDAGNSTDFHQCQLNQLGNLTSIREFCLERNHRALNFDSLTLMRNLETLSLYDCTRINSTHFLLMLPKLNKLCLSKCWIGELGCEVISQMIQLKELYLWHTHISDEGGDHFSKLLNLEILDISGNPNITDFAIENFGSLVKLILLDISNTQISIEAIERLKKRLTINIGYKELLGNPLMRRSKKIKLY